MGFPGKPFHLKPLLQLLMCQFKSLKGFIKLRIALAAVVTDGLNQQQASGENARKMSEYNKHMMLNRMSEYANQMPENMSIIDTICCNDHD